MPDAESNNGSAAPTSSIKITKHNDRSLFMLLLHSALRPFKGHIVKLGAPYPAGSPELKPDKRTLKKVDCRERVVEDIRIYYLSPKRKDEKEKKPATRLYYFAGGGWQSPATGEHWTLLAELATKLPDTAVSLVSYPLAPNSPAPETFPKLMKMYRTLMAEAEQAGQQVILAGDSAGGNIILSITIYAVLEDAQSGIEHSCPKALLAISPSTDLRRCNPGMAPLESCDPILSIHFIKETARAWCGDWDASDPRLSPLLADLTPLKKRGIQVHGITGSYDILSLDALSFRDKCAEVGVQGEWLDWEKQMHVFPLTFAYKLRESVEAKEWILNVLRRI